MLIFSCLIFIKSYPILNTFEACFWKSRFHVGPRIKIRLLYDLRFLNKEGENIVRFLTEHYGTVTSA